jgi:hypothetical protein
LDKILEIYPNAKDAMRAFGGDDDPPTHGGIFAKIKPRPSGGTTARDVDPNEE